MSSKPAPTPIKKFLVITNEDVMIFASGVVGTGFRKDFREEVKLELIRQTALEWRQH